MTKLRFGIIGYGAQGSMYASFIEQGMVKSMDLVAICDIDEAKQAKLKEAFPNKKIYSDYKEMITSGDVDAIITTVPHYLHPEMATFALDNGVHVLNEKPAGVYTKQVKA
ncbi:Gfo/Idh/MocA family protein [Halolactibacillus sp. JCM 19043]|nr:Gfo/Idh/MocA family oxidoreductase [Halolactibacillus sp. JCM 19043]